MKNMIIAQKEIKRIQHTNEEKAILHFYLLSKSGEYYLFTQRFSKGVYEYFKNGKSENEIKQFNKWKRNPRLNKTIEKIPMYTKYVYKQVV